MYIVITLSVIMVDSWLIYGFSHPPDELYRFPACAASRHQCALADTSVHSSEEVDVEEDEDEEDPASRSSCMSLSTVDASGASVTGLSIRYSTGGH